MSENTFNVALPTSVIIECKTSKDVDERKAGNASVYTVEVQLSHLTGEQIADWLAASNSPRVHLQSHIRSALKDGKEVPAVYKLPATGEKRSAGPSDDQLAKFAKEYKSVTGIDLTGDFLKTTFVLFQKAMKK